MRNLAYYELLKVWCDGLLKYQIDDPGRPEFHGALLCPACKCIHGRCHDAVHPLLYMAEATGEQRYLEAAAAVFDWGENLVCDDGSLYNDAQSSWNGITVFTVMGLYEALAHHGGILDDGVRQRMEQRMERAAAWIYRTFSGEFVTNINYHASAAAALAMAGHYLDHGEYLELADVLAGRCREHILADGLLYGEGRPMEHVTARGCRPVDIGYNAEESLPALLTFARIRGNREMTAALREVLRRQLIFMLPDGAWDNSFGTRNFKWTYWGSRTSDGCHPAYCSWDDEEPVFREAARRNLELLRACTADGLLYGGPDYLVHGERPCIHHTFCHARALAEVLDGAGQHNHETRKAETPAAVCLPAETAEGIFHFPAPDVYKIFRHDWIATVTAGDFEYLKGGHASGGTLTMLWHPRFGPVLLSAMTDYSMPEEHNMQLSLQKSAHRSLTPRLEMMEMGRCYAQCYDYSAVINTIYDQDSGRPMTRPGTGIRVQTMLRDQGQNLPVRPVSAKLCYSFASGRMRIEAALTGAGTADTRLVLPVIGRRDAGFVRAGDSVLIPAGAGYDGLLKVTSGRCVNDPEPIFFLAGGFEAWSFEIRPDGDGNLWVELQILSKNDSCVL